MLIGYCRTSTAEQAAGLAAQVRDLKALGADKIFSEQVSSVAERAELQKALDFAREGDTLVVAKLDRLARSMANLMDIQERLKAKGVGLKILDLGLDTSSASGELILNVLGSIAQFERKIMLERQREGIAAAKEAGKYKGRKPTAMLKASRILALHAAGKKIPEIVAETGVSRASVYRVLEQAST
ncbi:recombinase family protein [Methylocapsa sp. D3K7]|uniref:recombinase family protein n=1 Tax=Methylocapsa sp. D3K7 TaxID=3041435 RepID=UPI00244EB1CE|nr:recombinase family protein [Methylocapsa sp. D3K7]WGJ16141.1 recombinase family protein [Methylocapsa sp. D3K7]